MDPASTTRCRCQSDASTPTERQAARHLHQRRRHDRAPRRVRPTDGAKIEAAIGAETNRLFHNDGGRNDASTARTPTQRRADALLGLLTGANTGRGDKNASTPAPVRHQLIVVATLEDGVITDGLLADGSALLVSVIKRLACGSDLFGAVFSAERDPLWMGRKVRTATDGQWRSLIVRDGGCRICDADPSMSEAHHIIVWQPPGCGPTDIDDLILLCGHHHHLIHDFGYRLVKDDDGWTLVPP